ncbi:hypothetical protein AB1N83_009335 [Pleurotus pulmonarius]
MYDILEAHRWAVARRGILHRDISHGNIIIGAKDYVGEEQDNKFKDENPPVFVNEVLTGIPSDPAARLLDFDNGIQLSCPNTGSEVVNESGPMRQRTGTPKFIARAEIRAVNVPIPTEVKQRVSYKPPIRGQIISVSTLGKRSSYSITEPEEPEAKRRHMFSILSPNLSDHLPSPLSDEGNTTSSDELEEEEEVDWIEAEEAWIDLNATPTPLKYDSEGEETSA